MSVQPTSASTFIDPSVEISPREMEIVQQRIQGMKKLLEDGQVKPKYKVELRFGRARSKINPTSGMISFWHHGSQFHGGGDEKAYMCPGSSLKINGCSRLLPEEGVAQGKVICPYCGTIWKGEEVVGELAYRLTMTKWAQVMLQAFVCAERDADLVLKFSADDLRSVALSAPSAKREDSLDKTRSRRALHVYPLRNIIKDTSNGADLYKRFYAFLTS